MRIPDVLPEDSVSDNGPIKAIPIEDLYEIDLSSSVPILKWCAYCKAEIKSEVDYVDTPPTFWSSVSIFVLGGVFGCFMIPYMMNTWKGRKLKCTRCKHYY